MKLALGAFIAHLRKEKGLTQKQLAEMLSVSDKTVSHWEREESSPDISLLPAIADIFDITVDELLKGERNDLSSDGEPETKTDKTKNTAILYALESSFNKFRTKNYISIGLSVIAVLCGFIVQYFKSIYPGYLVFLTLTVVPLLLTAVFRSGFSSQLSSPYIDKDILKNYKYKANRITVNCVYFFFVCFVGYSIYVVLFNLPYFAVILLGILLGAGIIVLSEVLLRKADKLISSGKPLKIKKLTVLRILSALLTVLLLWAGLVSLTSIDKESLIFENAEYTLFSDPAQFIEYMETEKEAPDETYNDGFCFTQFDKGDVYSFYPEFGYDNTEIEILDPDYDGYIEFTYNNLEVAHYTYTEEGFAVYTHEQLITAEKAADKRFTALIALHIVCFIAVVVIVFIVYRIIKKRILKSKKSDTITLIKDF